MPAYLYSIVRLGKSWVPLNNFIILDTSEVGFSATESDLLFLPYI